MKILNISNVNKKNRILQKNYVMLTDDLSSLLDTQEMGSILKLFELFAQNSKVYLCKLETQLGIPKYVIKEYLKKNYSLDYLKCKVHKLSNCYFTLRGKYSNNNNKYAIFQRYIRPYNREQLYVHTWIVSKILGVSYDYFDKMDFTAHHINFNKLDNRFINLMPMPKNVHTQYHKAILRGINADPLWFVEEYCVDQKYKILLNDYITKVRQLKTIN